MDNLTNKGAMEREVLNELPPETPHGEEANFLDLLIVLAKNKRRIIALPLGAAVVSAAISFVLPDVFQASTKLMPPQQNQSGAAALLSQLGGMAGAAASVAGVKNSSDLYVGMLQSRTVADRLIAQFRLKTVYGTDSQEKARKELKDNTTVNIGKDGLITIDVEDSDRGRVAQLANAYVEQLQRLTKELAVTEAGQRRLFYEQQLEQAKDNLAAAESALKTSLDKNGVISVDSESRAIVETVGRLRAQISLKEIELNSMQSFVTSNNPSYLRIKEELASLRSELAKLENGRNAENPNDNPLHNHTGLQNIKLLRDVKYYQMLYELLAKQYEVARLDEAKDPSVIQILDTAQVPEHKFKPKRLIIVLLSAVLGFLVAIGYSYWSEMKKRMLKSPRVSSQLKELRSHL